MNTTTKVISNFKVLRKSNKSSGRWWPAAASQGCTTTQSKVNANQRLTVKFNVSGKSN